MGAKQVAIKEVQAIPEAWQALFLVTCQTQKHILYHWNCKIRSAISQSILDRLAWNFEHDVFEVLAWCWWHQEALNFPFKDVHFGLNLVIVSIKQLWWLQYSIKCAVKLHAPLQICGLAASKISKVSMKNYRGRSQLIVVCYGVTTDLICWYCLIANLPDTDCKIICNSFLRITHSL